MCNNHKMMQQDPTPIRADVTSSGLVMDKGRLTAMLAQLPSGAPVVAMVHGWRYAPGISGDCPHGSILSLDPPAGDRRAISWPRHLRLDGRQGLAIALGWPARCDPWRAHARAATAGVALARIARIVQASSGRPLHVIAHSMGARVALSGLSLATPGQFGRIILLAAAEARGSALAALASPAGRSAQIINVTTRENDLFDACFEWGLHLGLRTSIGQGLGRGHRGWHDLWIDQPQTRSVLASLGHPLASPPGRICHWSPYLRPGTFPLYRALLDGSLAAGHLPQSRAARRWSRLFGRPGPWGLPPGSSLPIP